MKSLLTFGFPLPRPGAGKCLSALASLLAGLTMAAPAAGQVVIGGSNGPRPAVVIDLGALTGSPGTGAPSQIPGLRYGPVPPPFPDFVPPSEIYLPLAVTPPPLRPTAPMTADRPASGVPAPEIHLPVPPATETPAPTPTTAAAPPTPVLPGPGQPITGAAPPAPALADPAPADVAPPPQSDPPTPVPTQAEDLAAPIPPTPVLAEAAPELSVPAIVQDIPAPPEPVRRPASVTPLPTPAAPPPATPLTPTPPPDTPDLGDLTTPDEPGILQERPPAPVAGAPEPRIQTVDPPGTDVAALDPDIAVEALDEDSFRIRFAAGSSDPGPAAVSLLSSLVDRMSANGGVRLEIKAYADTGAGTPGDARRLSLRRALAIRTFLVDSGIESTRIDVKALGDTAPDSPADRVDLFLAG